MECIPEETQGQAPHNKNPRHHTVGDISWAPPHHLSVGDISLLRILQVHREDDKKGGPQTFVKDYHLYLDF